MAHMIKDVQLTLIDPNPYRDLATYPWMEDKVEQLMRSIHDVGFWESVIARPIQSRFETAFGHHRIEAARRLKLASVPLIIRPMLDLDMLKLMGRENGEDYRSDFLSMLNTWEGAVRYAAPQQCSVKWRGKSEGIDIAKLLGWTHRHAGKTSKGWQMSATAAACAAAYDLVRDGHLNRDDLRGLNVLKARELVVVTHKEIEGLARLGAREKRDHRETKAAQNIVVRSARSAAEDARRGNLATNEIRNEVRKNIMQHVHGHRQKVKLIPLFAHFSAAVCQKIDNMLATDRAAQHISEIERVLDQITLQEDFDVLRKLHHSLDELMLRTERSKLRTTPNKVVKLQTIKGDAP